MPHSFILFLSLKILKYIILKKIWIYYITFKVFSKNTFFEICFKLLFLYIEHRRSEWTQSKYQLVKPSEDQSQFPMRFLLLTNVCTIKDYPCHYSQAIGICLTSETPPL